VTFDEALDELYGAPLDQFVAERKRLAAQLEGDDAKELAKLRKPSIAAWTLNQLARRERRDVDLLLDAGHRLRQAGLDKPAVERARKAEIDALKRLHAAARRLGAREQTLTNVDEALRASAVTEAGREQLALGRFTEPPAASVGFEAYAGLEVPKRKPKAKPKPRVSPELRAAEEQVQRLREQLAAAEQRLDELRGEA
jgi:D-serine deaminase-like pyridoxal phosphate-dependent protein